MQSIKTMSEELNDKFLANAGKIVIALGLVVLLYSFCSFFIESLYFILVKLFPKSFTTIFTIGFVFVVLTMFFVLHYGVMVLITRLERNQPSSIGYLFLGFKHTRTSGAVWIFSILLFVCLVLSLMPVILNIDLSTQESIEKFLTNQQVINLVILGKTFEVSVLTVCLQVGALIFCVSFCVLFYMFSFVWIIIYDLPDVVGINACIRSFKMVKSHFFHFFGFLVYISRNCIFIILAIDFIKLMLFCFSKKMLNSFLGYLFGLLGFIVVLVFTSKISIAIPFYYDKISEDAKVNN
ncbi:MAG: hypothetical protein KBT21_02685 [Treponema sp.]|nr:hypothetical protein [Candidatus Treponema merdequi]